MNKLEVKIKSWEGNLTEAKLMCNIEGLVAHDYIPDSEETLENWQLNDPKYFNDKLVAEISSEMVGCMHISQGREENSHILFFNLFVNPKYQNQGVGTAMYNKLITKCKSLGCAKIHSHIYDHPNWASGKSFFKKHKFEHIATNREYSLVLQNKDLTQYKPLLDEVLNRGFTFVEPIKDGLDSDDHYKKLEEMRWSYFQDMPYPEGIIPTRVNYELWLKRHKLFEKERFLWKFSLSKNIFFVLFL